MKFNDLTWTQEDSDALSATNDHPIKWMPLAFCPPVWGREIIVISAPPGLERTRIHAVCIHNEYDLRIYLKAGYSHWTSVPELWGSDE